MSALWVLQTTFIMSVAPASPASTLVAISGVVQNPSNYTVSSTSLTFLTAPPSGTNNISARYLGVVAAGVLTKQQAVGLNLVFGR